MSSPQKKPWHKDVKEIVDRVWTDRDRILGGPDETEEKEETIDERLYDYYAPTVPMKQPGITADEYQKQVRELDKLGKSYHFEYDNSQEGGFRRYGFTGQRLVKCHAKYARPEQGIMRLYINVKPEYAHRVCANLFALCGTYSKSLPPDKLSEEKRYEGPYAYAIDMFKVAEGSAAFSSRRDKIVVYLIGGLAEAGFLAFDLYKKCVSSAKRELWLGDVDRRDPVYKSSLQTLYKLWFNPEVPLMTRQFMPGISFAWEQTGKQWDVGTSFGEVRCSLIGRALVEVTTGKKYKELENYYEKQNKFWYQQYDWKPGDEVDEDADPPVRKRPLDWKITYVGVDKDLIPKLRAPLEGRLLRQKVPQITEFYEAVERFFSDYQLDISLPYRNCPLSRPPRVPGRAVPPIPHFVIQ